jgi:hypothetical protein
MAQEWNIRPRAGQCSACQTIFADGQPYHTRLTFEAADYSRGDFCDPCWAAESVRQPGYSSWRGIFKTPLQEPDHRVRKETAENLLRDLIEQGDPARRNAIYILAVMLERQRVFVEREVRTADDGTRLVVYEHKKTAETFAITDPQLKLSEIDPVQQEIMTLLTGKPAVSPALPANALPAE